jgi:hypothetical protein
MLFGNVLHWIVIVNIVVVARVHSQLLLLAL